MNDLESALRRIRLREPSPDLDNRVYAQRPPQSSNSRDMRPPRSRRWIVAWSLAACLVGFILGRATSPKAVTELREEPKLSPMAVTFTFPADRNLFDATVPAKRFGKQNWIVTTSAKEKEQ